MKSNFPSRDTIRQYLLGRLDSQSDLETRLSELMLFNDELWEIVDSIEDEIIEDYLDRAVSVSDQAAIEEYFLRPAERREKLQFARLLRSRFGTTSNTVAKKKTRSFL